MRLHDLGGAGCTRNGDWDRYARFTINGRDAANAVGAQVGGQGELGSTALVDAGGGVVMFMVTRTDKPGLGDPRPVSRTIATDVEPRLPE